MHDIDHDTGESVLRQIKTVSGERGEGCPWWALGEGFAQAVIRAHRYWAKGSLGERGAQPEALIRGLEVFDQALNAVQSWDIEHRNDGQPDEAPAPTRAKPRKRPPRSR